MGEFILFLLFVLAVLFELMLLAWIPNRIVTRLRGTDRKAPAYVVLYFVLLLTFQSLGFVFGLGNAPRHHMFGGIWFYFFAIFGAGVGGAAAAILGFGIAAGVAAKDEMREAESKKTKRP
jgi:hypothetical protein